MRTIAITSAIVVALVSWSAAAGDVLWPPIGDRKKCNVATDGCQICKLDVVGDLIGCSTPGIACQPKQWTCSQRRDGKENKSTN